MGWVGHVARREMRNTYTILVRTSEGKRPFGRPRRRRHTNIKLTGYERVDWIQLTQNRDHWRALSNELPVSINGGKSLG